MNDMIKKSKWASNYTVLPNKVFNLKMSPEAIGVLCYLLSKPCDWIVYKTTIKDEFGIGKDKCNRILKELSNNGYMSTTRKRGDSGKWEYTTIVYDNPYTDYPSTVNPCSGYPSPVNQPLLSKDILSTNILSKEHTKVSVDTWDQLLKKFNKLLGRKHRIVTDKAKRNYKARIKEGYTDNDIEKVVLNIMNDDYHKETNYKYVTLEYCLRQEPFERFLITESKQESGFKPKTGNYVK